MNIYKIILSHFWLFKKMHGSDTTKLFGENMFLIRKGKRKT